MTLIIIFILSDHLGRHNLLIDCKLATSLT
nr:MAG TPA: hypothetical protein [Caudoviricetes sp.]